MRQLQHWLWEHKESGENCKGILIINPFCLNPPSERPPSPQHALIVKEAERWATKSDVSVITTMDLFAWVDKALVGNLNVDVKNQLLAGTGLVRLQNLFRIRDKF